MYYLEFVNFFIPKMFNNSRSECRRILSDFENFKTTFNAVIKFLILNDELIFDPNYEILLSTLTLKSLSE